MKSGTERLLIIAAGVLSLLMVAWTSFPGVVDLSQPQQTPIVISQPGSYRLVSNLTSTGPELEVIHIDADNVTINLNGFTIFPGLHAAGIDARRADASKHTNIVIENGSITGGSGGIFVGDNSMIRDVNLASAGLNLICGDNCIVDHVLRTPGPEGQAGGLVPGMVCGSGCQIHSVIIAFFICKSSCQCACFELSGRLSANG